MRLIDADPFGVISLQGKSEDFIEGVKFILEKIDQAPTIETKTKKCPICGSDLYEHCGMCCYEGEKVTKND